VTALGNQVAQVSVGDLFACARKTDGTVWCWGGGGFLGNGDDATSAVPIQVSALGNTVAQIATGDLAACARKNDGTLWCWGANDSGIVGDGSTTDRLAPVPVTALGASVAEVSVGDLFTCARKTDGSVWCWGANDDGQLGDGTTTTRPAPVRVTLADNLNVELSANGRHACARHASGALWCWGANARGELGVGGTADALTPVRVSALGTTVAELSAGINEDTCARTTDGTVWCWGNGTSGQLGDGTLVDRSLPVRVALAGPPTVAAPSGGPGTAVLMSVLLAATGLSTLRRPRLFRARRGGTVAQLAFGKNAKPTAARISAKATR
jgi:alpha-tubulin suppressor-like RCC1 family protein